MSWATVSSSPKIMPLNIPMGANDQITRMMS